MIDERRAGLRSTDGDRIGRGLTALVIAPSAVMVAFGVWHFFVPAAWNWYDYMDPGAPELVIAVRAINVFFSLCLVLFGGMNAAIALRRPAERFALTVMVTASAVLWLARVILQIMFPQGSEIPVVQWSMLSVFVLTFAAYSGAAIRLIAGSRRQPRLS